MLKGIETQIMVTRTTEIMREADAQQRRNELARDFQAAQTQALAEHEQKQVTQTSKTQEARIQRDKQEKGKQSRNQQGQAQPAFEDDAEGEYETTQVEMGNYIINVKI